VEVARDWRHLILEVVYQIYDGSSSLPLKYLRWCKVCFTTKILFFKTTMLPSPRIAKMMENLLCDHNRPFFRDCSSPNYSCLHLYLRATPSDSLKIFWDVIFSEQVELVDGTNSVSILWYPRTWSTWRFGAVPKCQARGNLALKQGQPDNNYIAIDFVFVGSPPNTSTSARVCGCGCILGWWFILLEAMEVVVIIIQECAALRQRTSPD
jgi:hypothetical protein